MDKLFLDANVLFSAAYTPNSRLVELWSLSDARLLASLYALEEARRNLAVHRSEGIRALDELVGRVTIVPGTSFAPLPEGIELAQKDVPILFAAVGLGASHLLTGDIRHFGEFLGRRVGGVMIQTPAQYLRDKRA